MPFLESVGTGIVANYLYETAKRKIPVHMREYVPALYNANPAHLREAEKILEEAITEIRAKYKSSNTIQIFLGPEKLRTEGVLSPVLDYLIDSGPNPENKIRRSLQTCVVGGEFPAKGVQPNVEIGRIAREITRIVEQKFRRSERMVGFLTYTCLRSLQEKMDAVAKTLSDEKAQEENKRTNNAFLKHYLDDLKNVSKRLRLHGVEKITSHGTLSQDLMATYIEVEAFCPGSKKKNSKGFISPKRTRFRAEEIVNDVQKAIFKGQAGSGKTTVFQKLILDASFDGRNGVLPIYLPLRRLERGYTEEWTIEASFQTAIKNPVIQANIPLELVDQLNSLGDRVIFLLDGLDELSERTRTRLWHLVDDIQSRLENAKIFITTRPLSNVHHADGTIKDSIYADRTAFNRARLQWRPSPDFLEFTIGDLSNTQISTFIDRWFDGVDTETRTLAGRDLNWEKLPHRLKALLFSAPHEDTLNLARSPLICSLVCLIFFLRDGTLPTSKRQLYEMATQLLIEVRDAARDVRVDPIFDIIDKDRRESLLQSIALEMQEGDIGQDNQSIEVPRQTVERIVGKWLSDHKLEKLPVSELIDLLVERCAIIREPSSGLVDFVHRSFMEFLSANEIVLKRGAHSVRSKIENEQWVATLGFAMNTPQGGVYFGGILIEELVSYIQAKYKKQEHRQVRRSLGYRIAGLLDHRAEYPSHNQDSIRRLCEIILPPSTLSEAFDCREVPIEFLGEMVDFKKASSAGGDAIKASGFLLAQHEDPRSAEYLSSGFQNHGDIDLILAINKSGRIPFSEHMALKKRIANGSYKKKVYLTADEIQELATRKLLGSDIGIRFPFNGKDFVGWDLLRKARDISLMTPVRSDWDAMLAGDTQKFRNCRSLEVIGGADFNFTDIAQLFPQCRLVILEDCRHFSAQGLDKLRTPEAIEFRRISYPISIDFKTASSSLESVDFLSCAEVICEEPEGSQLKVTFSDA